MFLLDRRCFEVFRYLFYHEKPEVITARMDERAANFWLDDHTHLLDIQMLTYNAHQAPQRLLKLLKAPSWALFLSMFHNAFEAMFTFEQMRLEFREEGYVIIRDGLKESFVDSPYYNLWLAVPDLIFLVLPLAVTSLML